MTSLTISQHLLIFVLGCFTSDLLTLARVPQVGNPCYNVMVGCVYVILLIVSCYW